MIAANSAWNILNFRGPLIDAFLGHGWRVVALAPRDDNAAPICALGADFIELEIDSSGTSPFRDAGLFLRYLGILRDLRPDAFLGFTVKPNIYGSIAAAMLRIPTFNNISGLGTAFMGSGPLNWAVSQLYRLALRPAARVFFQNPDDLRLFVGKGLVRAAQAHLIPGSGIDVERFRPVQPPSLAGRPLRFLFIGRLLRDKGLVEYVEAGRLLRRHRTDVELAILGFAGADNRTAVPIAEVARWSDEGAATYLGETDDVRPFIADCDCVVLPSYREGLPRSLLEGAAMARPLVATDVPGCRELVAEGVTGYLCQPRSSVSLAAAMDKILQQNPAERAAMGLRAREKVERDFDQSLVVKAYMDALQ